MENNCMPVTAKRLWNVLRVMLFMLRKGIAKRSRLLADLNMIMKLGKIARKALGNLMFHHHHHCSSSLYEYEFSYTSTTNCNKLRHINHHYPYSTKAPLTCDARNNDECNYDDNDQDNQSFDVPLSPILPGFGFGQSPAARQVRVTDSPFPAQNEVDADRHVDDAAEEFIQRFYRQLQLQKKMAD